MMTHVNGLDARIKSIVTLIEGTEVFSPDNVRKLKSQQEEFETRLEKKLEDLERSFSSQRMPTPRPSLGYSPIIDRQEVFLSIAFISILSTFLTQHKVLIFSGIQYSS